MPNPGQTEVVETQGNADDDFLARERAALGEDAEQFATAQDHVAGNAGVADDDLLGGGDAPAEEIGQFESSFPSVEAQTQNEVWVGLKLIYMLRTELTCGLI